MILYQADYILPITSPPIRGGAVVVDQGRIVGRGEAGEQKAGFPAAQVVQIGSVSPGATTVLLPGLVNAHTHLDLCTARGKIARCSGSQGLTFVDWIEEVVRHKARVGEEEKMAAIRQGLRELLGSGVTTIGDISPDGFSIKLLAEAGLRATVFLEVVGFASTNAGAVTEKLERYLADLGSLATGLIKLGVSPHAPYSVSPALWKRVSQISRERRCPIASHVAEDLEEMIFLSAGAGRWPDFLRRRGVWDESWSSPGLSPVQYLDSLGVLAPSLAAVHLNYLSSQDIELLARRRVSAVTCPRSNRWFGRRADKLQALLCAGITTALGADSLASNWSLDMWAEMRQLHQDYPGVAAEDIIRMATISGAKTLGQDSETGSLEEGKSADLIGVAVPRQSANDIYGSLLASPPEIVLILIAGNSPNPNNSGLITRSRWSLS